MQLFLWTTGYLLALAVAEQHHVAVREVSDTNLDKFPDELHLHFPLLDGNVNLRLKRNVKFDTHIPVTLASSRSKRDTKLHLEDVALYQDLDNFATVSLKATEDGKRYKRSLSGSFQHKGKHYTIEPKNTSTHVVQHRPTQDLHKATASVLKKVKMPPIFKRSFKKPVYRRAKRSAAMKERVPAILEKISGGKKLAELKPPPKFTKRRKNIISFNKPVHSRTKRSTNLKDLVSLKAPPTLTSNAYNNPMDFQGKNTLPDGKNLVQLKSPPVFKKFKSRREVFDRRKRSAKAANKVARKKRSVSNEEEYAVEVKFVIDFALWNKFQKRSNYNLRMALADLHFHFTHILNGMDLVYSGILKPEDGFSIDLFLAGYYIAEEPLAASWVTSDSIMKKGDTPKETVINGEEMLRKLIEWTGTVEPSDHTMLWTAYNIFGSSEHTIGIALPDGICDGQGASACEYTDFHGWQVAAHELAHNLGAPHDQSGTECGGYVMEPVNILLESDSMASKAYQLSSCSKQYIRSLLSGAVDGYPRICLMDKHCVKLGWKNYHKMPGERYSANEQCVLRSGHNDSQACNKDQEGSCRQIHCGIHGSCSSYYPLSPGAADGTPCGADKLCYKGKCVDKGFVEALGAKCKEHTVDTTVPEGMIDHSWFKHCFRLEAADGSVTTHCIPCSQMTKVWLGPSSCYLYPSVARFCPASCLSAGIRYPGDMMSNCYQLEFSFEYERQIFTCDSAANAGKCTDDVISYNCCKSCLKIP